jgi:hypothetical protein
MGPFMPLPFGLAGVVLGIVALVLVSNLRKEVEGLKEDIKELKEKKTKK